MKKSILIVENVPHWQAMLRHILEREGYSAETVSSYGDARTQLQYKKFDLAVVDLRLQSEELPDFEGMEVVKYVYSKGVRSIVLTAYGSSELAKQAFEEYSVVGFLSKKDFVPEEFRELVKRGLGQSGSVNTNNSHRTTDSLPGRWIWPRVGGVLDNILAGIISSLLLYLLGVVTGVINTNPLTWLDSLPSIIYIVLAVIVVLLVVLAYTLWERNRRK